MYSTEFVHNLPLSPYERNKNDIVFEIVQKHLHFFLTKKAPASLLWCNSSCSVCVC